MVNYDIKLDIYQIHQLLNVIAYLFILLFLLNRTHLFT